MSRTRLRRVLERGLSARPTVAVGLVLLFVGLLVLPSLARFAYYYRGIYRSPDVARPAHDAVRLPTLAVVPADTALAGQEEAAVKGRVIIDRAHENEVDDADLNVLVSYLTARGLETVSNADVSGAQSGPTWPEMLRGASALIVASPHEPFVASELEAVERFVEQGGLSW